VESKTLALGLGLLALITTTTSAYAVEQTNQKPNEPTLLSRYSANAHDMALRALSFIDIRYRFGGNTPESGFDCSGMVRRVVHDVLGLKLPRTARDMSQVGQPVRREDLKPGDLVFFNTLRRAFSHVGIYLGENRFVHAPSTGGGVRIDDMQEKYWVGRFNGARRVVAAD
jgi:cell wall-associated NlpC family hydrolase